MVPAVRGETPARANDWICLRGTCFFFNDTATTEIYTSVNTLSRHDALPIGRHLERGAHRGIGHARPEDRRRVGRVARSEEHTSELQSLTDISYAVFCLK